MRFLLPLLLISTHPLLQQAREMEKKGAYARAWELYLEAYTRNPVQRSGVEALYGAARAALATGDTFTARGFLLRVLNHPLPVPSVLQGALDLHLHLTPEQTRWEILRRHPEWLPLVSPESLWSWRNTVPDTLVLWWGTWGRSLDPAHRERWGRWVARRLQNSTRCSHHLMLARWEKRQADTAWARLCEGDTLAALWWVRRHPSTGSLDTVLHRWALAQPDQRCLPGGDPRVSCTGALTLLDSLAQGFLSDSARADSLLLWMQTSGRWPRWMIQRWIRQRTRPVPDQTFLPLFPPPGSLDSLLRWLPTLNETLLLSKALEMGVYDLAWRPPAGSSRVDQLLFKLHLQRFRRDTLWHRPPGVSPESLLTWALHLGSTGFVPALRLSLLLDRYPLPFRSIPLRRVPREVRIQLARWMGRHHLLKDLPTLLKTLSRKEDRRRARFWAFLEAGQVDSSFRFLNPKRPDEVLAQAQHDPEIRDDLIHLLRLQDTPMDTAILRLWMEQDTLPSKADTYAFRALPPPLIRQLHRLLARQALFRGEREAFLRYALAVNQDTLLLPMVWIWLGWPAYAAAERWTLPESLYVRLPLTLQKRLKAWFPDRLRHDSRVQDEQETQDSIPPATDTARTEPPFPPPDQWEDLLLSSPDFPRKLFQEAQKEYREKKWKGAERKWTYLTHHPLVPRSLRAEALYRLGVLAKNTEDTLQAMRFFQQVLDRYPDSPRWSDAAFQLAYLALDRGDLDASLGVYARLRGQPSTPEEEAERLYWEMQTWYRKKEWKRGILLGWLLWNRYRQEGDWATTAALETARMYTLLGNLSDAQRLLDEILRVRGEKDELGRVALRERKTLQTLQELRRTAP